MSDEREARGRTGERDAPDKDERRDLAAHFYDREWWDVLVPEDEEADFRSEIRRAIGGDLRKWRESAHQSLADVERSLKREVKTSYLSQLERGLLPTPRIETLILLARRYGVTPWQLIEDLADAILLTGFFETKNPAHQNLLRQFKEIERVFGFVSEGSDFPSKRIRIRPQAFATATPIVKLALILMYEELSGLRVLPRWVLDPPDKSTPGREGGEADDDSVGAETANDGG
jgi:transcriptional regulator with XRE-family HTH domain